MRFLVVPAYLLICCIVILVMVYSNDKEGRTMEASWYSRASCQREFGSSWDGKTASGKELDDEAFTCASWDYNFNTTLQVTNSATNRSVLVTVSDRGPAKRLYKEGRRIDLSKAAFEKIATLNDGLATVRVREI